MDRRRGQSNCQGTTPNIQGISERQGSVLTFWLQLCVCLIFLCCVFLFYINILNYAYLCVPGCVCTRVQVLLEAGRVCQILWNWSVGGYNPELWVLGTKLRSPTSSTLSQPLSCVSSPWFTVLKTESRNARGYSCFGFKANIYSKWV